MTETTPRLRDAVETDLPALVALLADDPLGASRERAQETPSQSYRTALRAITTDPHHHLLVVELDAAVIGMLQLSFLPHLTYQGGWRAQIEGVRVAREHRSRGIGRMMLETAVGRARERGCHLVQLTTDRRRPEALRFYLDLGFEDSHHGLKLHLDGRTP
jgi:ribosomal protein S18 acetylase RimI-like enzyme